MDGRLPTVSGENHAPGGKGGAGRRLGKRAGKPRIRAIAVSERRVTMAKAVFGIVAGIFVALATVFAIDLAGHQIYPLPSDLSMDDYGAVEAYVHARPAGASAFVLIAWFLGAADGGLVAALVS